MATFRGNDDAIFGRKVRLSSHGIAWDDLRVPLVSTKGGGVRAPGFAQFRDDGAGSTGVYAYAFDATAEEELFFAVQMPHGYKLGTDIEPHVHWGVTGAPTNGQTVIWGLEYTWGRIKSATLFPTTAVVTGTHTWNTANAWEAAYGHQLTELTPISGAGFTTVSTMLLCRLFRDATADTHAADAFAFEVDFHYQLDSLGSLTATSKD